MATRCQNVLETGTFSLRSVALTTTSKVTSLSFVVTLYTDCIAYQKREEVRVMFSLASFVSIIFTIAKIISVLLVSTRLHGFVNSKDNTICLAFFCRIGSQIGPHVVIFRAGRSIFSWQEHGSF